MIAETNEIDLLCRCSRDEAAKVDAMVATVMEKLNSGYRRHGWNDLVITDRGALANAAMTIMTGLSRGTITIEGDQWHMVTWSPTRQGRQPALSIMCDEPLDGVIWLYGQWEEDDADGESDRQGGTDGG